MGITKEQNSKTYTINDLEDILDSLPSSIWMKDKDGRYIYVNKNFCDAMNRSKDEIIGKTDSDFGNEKMAHLFKNDDEAVLKQGLPQYTDTKITIQGKDKWMHTFKAPIKRSLNKQPAITASSTDITFQKELEMDKSMEISNMEQKLNRFLDTASDLYCIVKSDGTFEQVNHNFFKYLGWNEFELSNMKYQDLIHPDDYENSLKCRINANKNNILKGSGLINRYKCKNGHYKTFLWNWHSLKDENCIIMTGKNITSIILLQEQMEKLKKEIELETLKTSFFANISHEFRTPINIILTAIQLIEKTNSNDKIKKYIYSIMQNSYRLLRLVNNVLEMTKIDGGYNELKLTNCNIVTLIEDIVDSVAEHINNKNRSIIFDTDEEEIMTCCDPDKIETIMLNLLSNAIKFTNPNGHIEIKISLVPAKDFVLISVFDDGISIDKKYAKLIFKKFTQIDDLLNRPCEGSGLGLALTESLVRFHGGKIWINTDRAQGAEFVFSLPVKLCSQKCPSQINSKLLNANIERYNVEFSDIYNLE